jgi:hypothetical protein
MNEMKTVNYFSILSAILLMNLMSGCGIEYPQYEVTEQFFVNTALLNMNVGDEKQIVVSPSDSKYTWRSDNESVATVSQTGLVKAVGAGFATIYVKSGDIESKIDIFSRIYIPLDSIHIETTSVLLGIATSTQLWAYPVPEDATADVIWTSENPEIAAVDQTGVVSGVSEGTTNIIISCESSQKIVEITVKLLLSDEQTFNGPHILTMDTPCEIRSRDFDYGGEGVGFHDLSGRYQENNWQYRTNRGDENSKAVDIEIGNDNIGYVVTGEWLQYTIGVQDAGPYLVDVSTSVNANDSYMVFWMDGVATDEIGPVPNNNDWQSYRWAFASYPQLPQPIFNLGLGIHKFRYYFAGGAGNNLFAFKFTYAGK